MEQCVNSIGVKDCCRNQYKNYRYFMEILDYQIYERGKNMNEIIVDDKKVEDMIYEIRGKQVMLDSDLAKLYGVETKRINEAVKNNPNKFPDRFSFKLSNEELAICSRSKISTLNKKIRRRNYGTMNSIGVKDSCRNQYKNYKCFMEILDYQIYEGGKNMNEIIVDDKKVEDMIYEIRGKQVMLDSDLAKLYGVETKRINEAVKNNPNKFPDRFSFKLSNEELAICSRSKFSTLNKEKSKRGNNVKYLPRVFTEQGVAMLATILKSNIAIEVSIRIMDAFVYLRKYLSYENSSSIVLNHEKRILKLEESFNKMKEKTKISTIFYDGEIYDAYSLLFKISLTILFHSQLFKILNKAKSKIIIIDNYAGIELFDLIKEIKVKIIVYTKNVNDELLKKYNKEYSNLEVIKCDLFHDRFIVIDNKILYHSGASFKDLGNKCFALSLIEDKEILKGLLKYIKKKVNE